MSVENTDKYSNTSGGGLKAFIRFFDDARILKLAFYALLFGVVATLIADYRELIKNDTNSEFSNPVVDEPILPSFTPPTITQEDGTPAENRPRPEITTERDTLNQPMTIELKNNGVLELTGSISVGVAEKFKEKIEPITDYVKSVRLNSPGGSVYDALEVSTIIRENGWSTVVADGHLCASSCPLIFAGGEKRIAEDKAAIGIHQIFAVGKDERSNQEAVSGTQTTTARISRHLEKMGVDPVLWLHALETPPQNLFYLNRDELEKFDLVTK